MCPRPIPLLIAFAIALAAMSAEFAAAAEGQVTWCWGSQRRSENVPFLRITTHDGKLAVETKDYMHGNFVANTRKVVFADGHLDFSYWYRPLARWAHCNLTPGASGDTMAGNCDGELSAGRWGSVPSYLWRC
jgi:hypothetical protein